MLIKNHIKPLNETEVHFELKQIAKYILKSKGCSVIGEEVELGKSGLYLSDYPQFNDNSIDKCIIDTIGLKIYKTFDYYTLQEPTFRCIGIEAKASLSDFKNGFCCNTDRTYVIAPISVISRNLIPKHIGLIEVDLDNYSIHYSQRDGFTFKGIHETIKPITRIDDSFKDNKTKPIDNKYYQHWCKDVLRRIGYKSTNKDLFKHNQIVISGKKWRENK